MSKEDQKSFEQELETNELYSEEGYWHVNTGGKKIHAARIGGFYRNLRRLAQSVYLIFFIGPWIQYNGDKAIFFDIPHRQFHLFGLTVWPQDIWILAALLVLLAITLVGITAIAGRVFCGYFCFHMIWVDWFTLIEKWIEGSPRKRRELDAASMSLKKFGQRALKYAIWFSIAVFTAFTITAYFERPGELIFGYLTLSAPYAAWASLIINTAGVFIFTGFMREQVCFWLCPYARIQSVMIDKDTIWPTYDYRRGEPRTKYKKGPKDPKAGDCIDCNSCFNVCPTGVDIRNGMQEGCITCGMCIDACDAVMEKTNRPKGLIKYISAKELKGGKKPPRVYKRPRVLVYFTIFSIAATSIIYGLSTISPVEFAIIHERIPLYTKMSDGSIQNKYTVKILNKTETDLSFHMDVKSSKIQNPEDLRIVSERGQDFTLSAGKLVPFHVFLRANSEVITGESIPVTFIITESKDGEIRRTYRTMLAGPKP